jgi:hypothetical protein
MNKEIEEIKEAMHRQKLDQGALAERLSRLSGKKIGPAAVSKQLGQKKMSRRMLLAYREALHVEEGSAAAPSVPTTTLSEAARLIALCDREELLKVEKIVQALLSSDSSHRR